MAFQLIFPPQVHVLKRELLWIPFFGWGLALMSPIAIDRSRGMRALRTIARRGRERLAQGFWVVVFPEGTRVAPGEQRDYQPGGAWLAARAGAPVVPVAHNAGLRLAAQRLPEAPGHGHRAHRAADRRAPTATRRPINEHGQEQWIEEQQKALCLIELAGRDGRVPLRAPAPPHARHHGRRATACRSRRRCARRGARSRRFLREKERWILASSTSGRACRSRRCAAWRERRARCRCSASRSCCEVAPRRGAECATATPASSASPRR